MYDLATAPPHEDESARLSAAEFVVYSRGYYKAISMALQVMDFGERRWKMRVKTKRLETRRQNRQGR